MKKKDSRKVNPSVWPCGCWQAVPDAVMVQFRRPTKKRNGDIVDGKEGEGLERESKSRSAKAPIGSEEKSTSTYYVYRCVCVCVYLIDGFGQVVAVEAHKVVETVEIGVDVDAEALAVVHAQVARRQQLEVDAGRRQLHFGTVQVADAQEERRVGRQIVKVLRGVAARRRAVARTGRVDLVDVATLAHHRPAGLPPSSSHSQGYTSNHGHQTGRERKTIPASIFVRRVN